MKRFLCGILSLAISLLTPFVSIAENINEPLSQQMIINEVMIGSEVNPEKDSWIELYNPGAEPIAMEGWQIRGVTDGGRWIDVSNDAAHTILPDDYFLLSRYSNSSYSALSIKPEMTKSSIFFEEGEISIELRNPEGIIVDQIAFEHVRIDDYRSYSRTPENEWIQSELRINLKDSALNTFGTAHHANSEIQREEIVEEPVTVGAQDIAPETEIVTEDEIPETPVIAEETPNSTSYPNYQLINEIMVNPEGIDTEGEWIELYNATSHPIDLRGWYLDDADGNSRPYWIKEDTVIKSHGYKVFYNPELGLSLKNSEDQVRLLAPTKEAKEVISYSGAKENWTFGKRSDGVFEWGETITPGKENHFPPPPKAYPTESIIFKNILPNPEGKDNGLEKILMKNTTHEVINLERWTIRNQKGKEVKLLGEIDSMESLKLNPADIKLKLINKADSLVLIDPMGNLIDYVSWSQAKDNQLIYKPNYFEDGLQAEVTRVIDGDTFEANVKGDLMKIRLIGVDTPETVHPFKRIEEGGMEAAYYLKELLENQTVTLRFDETKTDKYNRLLAYVYLDDLFVNLNLIQEGYSTTYTRFPFKYMDEFLAAEQGDNIEESDDTVGTQDLASTDEVKNGPTDETDELWNVEEEEEIEIPYEPTCPTEGLEIAAILPNPQKGETTEFIRLINTSEQTICLSGWSLDDNVIKGSKPFQIKGGGIQPGGQRSFRLKETKVTLNNSNDCASLINPLGKVVDQICYNKTHKNEIFTHEGGNWVPKKRTKKVPLTRGIKGVKNPKRQQTALKYELRNETVEGRIAYIYEEGELFYLEAEERTIPVSYANSSVNISMAKTLLDFGKPITVHLRTGGEKSELIGLEQQPHATETKEKPASTRKWLGLIMLSGGFWVARKWWALI